MLKMVETAVRPRPHFSTFLLSDANAGGDGLSYYQYKKLLRSQKVVLLQQKQATAHIPGYKPPQKRITTRLSDYKPDISRRHTTSGTTTSSSSTTNDISSSSTTSTSGNKVNKKDVQTQTITVNKLDIPERSHKNQVTILPPPPAITLTARPTHHSSDKSVSHERHIKSATTRVKYNNKEQRPKTAEHSHLEKNPKPSSDDTQLEDIEERSTTPQPAGVVPTEVPTDINKLLKSYIWSTSTVRAYNDVNWATKLPPNLSYPSSSTLHNLPDPVSIRFTNKRNELHPKQWQTLGGTWDIVQTRPGSSSGTNTFCSPFKNNHQIPGYQGYAPDESDVSDGLVYHKLTTFTGPQPRPTSIARRANIPGYSGCSHWTNTQPVHSNIPIPTSYIKDYKMLPRDGNVSPFVRTSVMSKMITLTSPFNPFNKIEP